MVTLFGVTLGHRVNFIRTRHGFSLNGEVLIEIFYR